MNRSSVNIITKKKNKKIRRTKKKRRQSREIFGAKTNFVLTQRSALVCGGVVTLRRELAQGAVLVLVRPAPGGGPRRSRERASRRRGQWSGRRPPAASPDTDPANTSLLHRTATIIIDTF